MMKKDKAGKKVVHIKLFMSIFIVILILIVSHGVWKRLRKGSSISCHTMPSLPSSIYSEKERVINAIALSYLVYGCETCNGLSGTVSELIDDS